MNIRRWSIGLVAASLLVPGLTACNSTDGDSGAATSQTSVIPADPKEALLASTKEIGEGNFRFSMSSDSITGEGVMHLPSRSAQMTIKAGDPSSDFSMEAALIYIEPDSWVKLTFGGEVAELPGMEKLSSGKYLHLDQSRVKDIEDLTVDFNNVDPAGSDLLIKAIVDVKKTGEGVYSGTVDLSKATEAGAVDEAVVKALDAGANALPFEAKLDAQGRLTELTIKIPAAGETEAHDLKITYSDYGAATGPQKPAASEVEEAPEEAYQIFQ